MCVSQLPHHYLRANYKFTLDEWNWLYIVTEFGREKERGGGVMEIKYIRTIT